MKATELLAASVLWQLIPLRLVQPCSLALHRLSICLQGLSLEVQREACSATFSFPPGPSSQSKEKTTQQEMRTDSSWDRAWARSLHTCGRGHAWEDRAGIRNAFYFPCSSEPALVLGTRHVSQSTCPMKSMGKLSVLTSLPRGETSSETRSSRLLAHTSPSHFSGLFLELSQRVCMCLEPSFLAVTFLALFLTAGLKAMHGSVPHLA